MKDGYVVILFDLSIFSLTYVLQYNKLTWYDAGLGACGWTNSGSDFVAALSVERYGSGGNCGQVRYI